MTFTKKGTIVECTETPQYKDNKTGELGDRSYIAQVLIPSKMKNGNLRKDLIDIKIDESRFKEYSSKIGKEEEFEISFYSKTPIYLKAV
jgi:hypothetical protein